MGWDGCGQCLVLRIGAALPEVLIPTAAEHPLSLRQRTRELTDPADHLGEFAAACQVDFLERRSVALQVTMGVLEARVTMGAAQVDVLRALRFFEREQRREVPQREDATVPHEERFDGARLGVSGPRRPIGADLPRVEGGAKEQA